MSTEILSERMMAQARYMIERGDGWRHIAVSLNVSMHRIRKLFDPGYQQRIDEMNAQRRAERAAQPKKQRFRRVKTLAPCDDTQIVNSIPKEVLIDRDNRMSLVPVSLTAALFGDPLPGRSALDKKRENA